MNRLSLAACLVASLLVFGCTKPDDKPSVRNDPSEIPTFNIVGSTPATASASASASAPASASSAALPASATATGAPTAGTGKDAGKAAASSSAASGPPLKPASTKVTAENFALDVASPGCRVNEPCTMTIRLSALGAFHVNKEYPYKFIGTPAPTVAFLADGNTFDKASGDYKEDGEKHATMTVRFKPTSAGEAKVTGKYKMSVCAEEKCLVEQPVITLAVPVI